MFAKDPAWLGSFFNANYRLILAFDEFEQNGTEALLMGKTNSTRFQTQENLLGNKYHRTQPAKAQPLFSGTSKGISVR